MQPDEMCWQADALSCNTLTHNTFLASFAYHVGVVKNGAVQITIIGIAICLLHPETQSFTTQSKPRISKIVSVLCTLA